MHLFVRCSERNNDMRESSTTPDTVPHPPIMPRSNQALNEAEVLVLIDQRLREYDASRRTNQHMVDMRQKVMTYGVGGVIGAAVGAGTVLLVQKIKKGSGHKP